MFGHRVGKRFGRVALLAVLALVFSTSGAVAASDYTWTGASTSHAWTNGANWAGGLGPTGTVTSLNFPQLTSSACTASPATATCYDADGLDTGVSATALTVDDNQPYDIGTGYDIDLGSGGLTATPDSASTLTEAPTTFELGFDLTAPQTWSIDGGSQGDDGIVIENGSITGSEPLTVDFTHGGFLQTSGTVASLAASGPGTLIPAYGNSSGNLNANGNPITLADGASIYSPFASQVGAVSDTDTAGDGGEGDVDVGQGEAPDSQLGVEGTLNLGSGSGVGLYIDETGTSSGDFSSLTATGNITLNGTQLDLAQGADSDGECVDLNPGDTDTLLSTSGGTISGHFANAASGTTIAVDNDCDSTPESATAEINYTSTTVTATIVSGGDAGDAAQNTSPPTISGTFAVGQTLTAAPGAWAGNPTFTYQWYSCPSASSCSPIAGATGATFVPTTAQLYQQLAVEVTGTNPVGAGTAYSNLSQAIGPSVPVNTAAPTISGTTTQGSTLTAAPGTWSSSPTAYGYQWERCSSTGTGCVAISGATKSTYLLGTADIGETVAVSVTAQNASGTGAAALSAKTAVIAAFASTSITGLRDIVTAPKLTTTPTISGDAVVGQSLQADGTFSGGRLSQVNNGITYTYVWQRCRTTAVKSCATISTARSSVYKVATGDVGYRLRSIITATDTAGTASGTSALSAVVLSPTQIKTALDKLIGPSGKAALIPTVIKQDGYRARYAAPAAGVISITWTTKSGGRKVTVATFKKTLTVRGTVTLTPKLNVAGKRLLAAARKAHRRFVLTAALSYKLADVKAITATRTVTLKP